MDVSTHWFVHMLKFSILALLLFLEINLSRKIKRNKDPPKKHNTQYSNK